MLDCKSDGWFLVESHCEVGADTAFSVDEFCKVPVQNIARHWLHTRPRAVVGGVAIVYAVLAGVEWATTVLWLAKQPLLLLCMLVLLPGASILLLRWLWSTGKAISFLMSFAATLSTVAPGYVSLALLPSLREKGASDTCLWPTLTVIAAEVCECLVIAIEEEWKEIAEKKGSSWCSYLGEVVTLVHGLSLQILATVLWLWMSAQLHKHLFHGAVTVFPVADTQDRAQLICALHVAGVVCREARRRLARECAALISANAAFRSLVSEWRENMQALSNIASSTLRYAQHCTPPGSALLVLAVLRSVAPTLLAPFAVLQMLFVCAGHTPLLVCGSAAILVWVTLIVKRVSARTVFTFPQFPPASHYSYVFFLVPSGWGLTQTQRARAARALHLTSAIWGLLGRTRLAIAAFRRPFASCVCRRLIN